MKSSRGASKIIIKARGRRESDPSNSEPMKVPTVVWNTTGSLVSHFETGDFTDSSQKEQRVCEDNNGDRVIIKINTGKSPQNNLASPCLVLPDTLTRACAEIGGISKEAVEPRIGQTFFEPSNEMSYSIPQQPLQMAQHFDFLNDEPGASYQRYLNSGYGLPGLGYNTNENELVHSSEPNSLKNYDNFPLTGQDMSSYLCDSSSSETGQITLTEAFQGGQNFFEKQDGSVSGANNVEPNGTLIGVGQAETVSTTCLVDRVGPSILIESLPDPNIAGTTNIARDNYLTYIPSQVGIPGKDSFTDLGGLANEERQTRPMCSATLSDHSEITVVETSNGMPTNLPPSYTEAEVAQTPALSLYRMNPEEEPYLGFEVEFMFQNISQRINCHPVAFANGKSIFHILVKTPVHIPLSGEQKVICCMVYGGIVSGCPLVISQQIRRSYSLTFSLPIIISLIHPRRPDLPIDLDPQYYLEPLQIACGLGDDELKRYAHRLLMVLHKLEYRETGMSQQWAVAALMKGVRATKEKRIIAKSLFKLKAYVKSQRLLNYALNRLN